MFVFSFVCYVPLTERLKLNYTKVRIISIYQGGNETGRTAFKTAVLLRNSLSNALGIIQLLCSAGWVWCGAGGGESERGRNYPVLKGKEDPLCGAMEKYGKNKILLSN